MGSENKIVIKRNFDGLTHVVGFLVLMMWLAGIAIAKGFWMTLFAIFPLYGIYLFVEHLMRYTGFMPT